MARQKWTRESAQAYLAGNPNFQFQKNPSEYKTAYLKRIASAYQKAEQQGKAPSRAVARGHAEPPRHIERREATKQQPGKRALPPRPEQYSIGNAERKPTPGDVRRLVEYAKKPPKAKKGQPARSPMQAKGGFISGNITGVLAQDYNAYKHAGDQVTLSFRVHENDFNALLASGMSLVDIANALFGASYPTVEAVYSEVFSVNVLA